MRKALLLMTLLAGAAQAQDFPAKPIRMVVGFPPGGGTDVVARILSPRWCAPTPDATRRSSRTSA